MTPGEALARAVRLARRGHGRVSPNPPVGAVILRDGVVVAEGWHGRFGGPHAEAEALRAAGPAARGATLVATMEPCGPFEGKKTPPCAAAIAAAGVARVVIGALDPNPAVAGRSVERLRAAGVAVEVVDDPASGALAEGFASWVTRRRPFVTAKWAATLDGRAAAADGSSRWITGAAARARVDRLRWTHDAVLVGAATALRDDPSLRIRTPAWREAWDGADPPAEVGRPPDPWRVVLAPRGLPPGLRLMKEDADGRTIVLPTADPAEALADLAGRGICSVLVEGGPRTITAFLARGLVDAVAAFIAPALLGAGPAAVGEIGIGSIGGAVRLHDARIEALDGDALVTGYLKTDV